VKSIEDLYRAHLSELAGSTTLDEQYLKSRIECLLGEIGVHKTNLIGYASDEIELDATKFDTFSVLELLETAILTLALRKDALRASHETLAAGQRCLFKTIGRGKIFTKQLDVVTQRLNVQTSAACNKCNGVSASLHSA